MANLGIRVPKIENAHALNNRLHTKVRNFKYPDVKDVEYLDMADEKLLVPGMLGILQHMNTDAVLKQADFSFNITQEEAFQPLRMAKFCESLCFTIKKNSCLTGIDLVGNHLGQFGPHPLNEQRYDIPLEIAKALTSGKSTITRIDISDNYLTGTQGRKLTALGHFSRHFIKHGGKYFLSRSNYIQSQGLVMIANGLGQDSQIEYLDLNDNQVGLDPSGMRNSEGIMRFAVQVQHTLGLRVLKLARNSLTDDDFELLSDALSHVATLQVLDLAGNRCIGVGMQFLANMILSHGVLDKKKGLGIRDLDISYNPIGSLGTTYLIPAVVRSETLEALNVAGCQMNTEDMYSFRDAMLLNGWIARLDVRFNICDPLSEAYAAAEGTANHSLVMLREDPQSVDATVFIAAEYDALARKLRFLEQNVLRAMHHNHSFNIPLTVMKERLHCLALPGRRYHLKEIASNTDAFDLRVAKSKEHSRRVHLTRKIFHAVLTWYRRVQYKNKVRAALLAQKRAEEEEARRQAELAALT
jgi:hypothetical protein